MRPASRRSVFVSSSRRRRSPSSMAPRTARVAPSVPAARSRAPRAATCAASRARLGDQGPGASNRTSRELFTRPVASRRCAARRRRTLTSEIPGPATGALKRHHARTRSPPLNSSRRNTSSTGTSTTSSRRRSTGVVASGTVTTLSALPPLRSRSGAATRRPTSSSSRVAHGPNVASRRRPASRQASP